MQDVTAAGGGSFVVVDRELADVASDRNGKMAGGIYVAEQNTGEGVAGFLAEIPAFENCGDFGGELCLGGSSCRSGIDAEQPESLTEDRMSTGAPHIGQVGEFGSLGCLQYRQM